MDRQKIIKEGIKALEEIDINDIPEETLCVIKRFVEKAILKNYIPKSALIALPSEEEIEIICIDKAGYMYPNQVKAIAKAIHKRINQQVIECVL